MYNYFMKNKIKNIKSFTIIELLISIIIFSFIIFVSFESLNSLNLFNTKLNENIEQNFQKEKEIELFINDFENSDLLDITTIDNTFDFIYIKTNNSLYGLHNPFVYYYIYEDKKEKKKNTLYRIETKFKLSLNSNFRIKDLFQKEDIYLTEKDRGFKNFYIDKLIDNLEIFKIQEKKSNYEENIKNINNNTSKNYLLILKEFDKKESFILPIKKRF